MATSNIQVRIEKELKENVEKILDDMGLDTRTIIRMLFKKIEDVKTIPFQPGKEVDENGLTPKQAKELLKAYEESFDPKNLEGPFYTAEEFLEGLK